jgi:hypothetical protein
MNHSEFEAQLESYVELGFWHKHADINAHVRAYTFDIITLFLLPLSTLPILINFDKWFPNNTLYRTPVSHHAMECFIIFLPVFISFFCL